MIVFISSAKTQRVTELPGAACTQPVLLDRAGQAAERCRKLSRAEIGALMKVSPALAESTHRRFRDFSIPHREPAAGPALATFGGEVFSRIGGKDFSAAELRFAQQRLRILSGLYGMLRPLDLMQPYRLEMGTAIDVGTAPDLYAFWGEAVTGQLNRDLARIDSRTLVNCASREYSRTVLTDRLEGEMVNVHFRQRRQGRIRTMAVHAKRARGLFVNWFITRRVSDRAHLAAFDRGGYRYAAELSGDAELVFVVDLPPR